MRPTLALLRALATTALAATAIATHASPPADAPQQQVYGAAATSPDTTRQVLTRLTTFCAAIEPTLRQSGDDALAGWTTRHAAYLAENQAVRAKWRQAADDPTIAVSLRATIHDLLDHVAPTTVETQFESLATPVRAMSPPSVQADMCRSYLHAVADGDFDLKKTDPTLATWFDRRIASRRVARAH